MNIATLTTNETSTRDEQFEAERALRTAFVRAWRADPTQNAAAHAAYAMIRGKSLDKTFSPITNPNKLACNSSNPHAGRDGAVETAKAGSAYAWGWAAEVLKEAGLERDRYGRYPLSSHPIIGAWITRSLATLA